MNDQLLASFIALVNFDQKIRALQDERTMFSSLRVSIDKQKLLLTHELEASKNLVHDFKKDVDKKELAMKILDQQETEKKRRLEVVTSAKEYTSLKSEISVINERQHIDEQALIEAWDVLDSAQKRYAADHANFQKKIDELTQQAQELDHKIETATHEIDEHEKQRLTLVSLVPSELLDNYEHMRGQVINPVVRVINNSCSACFYPVPAHDLAILRKGKFLPCKSCYRILFIEDSAFE